MIHTLSTLNPYTLHPTPLYSPLYTLNPQPSTINPITLYPVPYTLNPEP
jgi:hypothetical protein